MKNKILITGATGFVGSFLADYFSNRERQVIRLVRRQPVKNNEIFWNPDTQELDGSLLEDLDLVIHLSGKNIANSRWTPQVKKELFQSRIQSTQFLSEKLSKLSKKPKLFVSASAIGFYGDRQNEVLHEKSSVGSLLLSNICQPWQAATKKAQSSGIRTVFMRLGMVLSPKGGALQKMLPIFRWGLGGCLGSGHQWISWIALEEIGSILEHLLEKTEVRGPVNFASPQPVTNQEFTKTLAYILHRPAFFNVPAPLLTLLMGESTKELLLSSSRVQPKVLENSGYHFKFPEFKEYLLTLSINR